MPKMTTSQASFDDEHKAGCQNSPSMDASPPQHSRGGVRFWLVFLSLCLISFASALEGSIITTALPTIISNVGGSAQYVWIANSFILAQAVVQPPLAQLCNIFGRRNPTIISIALFTLGSGIAGGAANSAMLIAGRTVQGVGSGGIYMLVDLIVCDLVSQRERGTYLGIMLSTAAVGAVLGPVVGGALAQYAWRWVFYINLPIAGIALVVMVFFLNLKHKKEPTWMKALARVDWIGSVIFIGSLTAVLLGLISGGSVYPWSSARVIAPLVIGFVGWACYHIYEASPLCREPSTPPSLFTQRTSCVGFLLAFIAALLLQWSIYFLPIYFQGVKSTSQLTSGIDILPYNAFLIPAAMVAGGIMSKMGAYRPLHGIGFAFVALGVGLFIILDAASSRALWVVFQMFCAIGQGFLATTILPAIQSALSPAETATATGTYAFLRSFGFVWGVTIPSLIFNARIRQLAHTIDDASLRTQLLRDPYAGAARVQDLDAAGDLRASVNNVYATSLRDVWIGAVAFAACGILMSFISKHISLRTEAEGDFTLQDGRDDENKKRQDGD